SSHLEVIAVYFVGLATDGDGTLVRGKCMAKRTVQALRDLRRSGRKILLVTGERIGQVEDFPHLRLFDCVVAENGAMLYWPRTRTQRRLTSARPDRLLRAIREAGFRSAHHGQVAIAMNLADETRVRLLLRRLDADWHVIRNRHDLMLLPSGIDKSSGLRRALRRLHLAPSRAVAVG